MRRVHYLRCISGAFERLLHRILQRFFRHAGSPLEVLAGDLQVVLPGNRLRIADPTANSLQWELFRQFRLASRSQILEHFRPRLQSSPTNDFVKLGSQILIAVPVSVDNELSAGLSLLKCLFQEWAKFREHRNQPAFTPSKVFGLRTVDQNPAMLLIHVRPSQRKMF